jgi:ectoine hydroxylase
MADILHSDFQTTFAKKGYIAPVTLMTAGEMSTLRDSLDDLMKNQKNAEHSYSEVKVESGEKDPVETIYDAHLTNEDVKKLGTHPVIVKLAQKLLGGPVKLWRSTFWIKAPGARRLEWHQDTFKSEGFGSFPNVNVWVAIDPTNEENAVRMATGTHHQIIDLAEFKRPDYVAQMQNSPELPEPVFAPQGVEKMILQAGQCFVFDGRVLHGSPPNPMEGRRAGIVFRYIPQGFNLPGLKTPCLNLS